MERISIRMCQVSALVLVLGGWAADEREKELFRYIDENGVTVLDDDVPPDFVRRGYTVMDLQGRVVKVVPRALTQREIRARARQMELDKITSRKTTNRKAADAALLRLYSSTHDVMRARDSEISGIQELVDSARTKLHKQLTEKKQLEVGVADFEEAGKAIPKDRLNRIAGLEARIKKLRGEVTAGFLEIRRLKQAYSADFKRVQELYALPGKRS